MKPEKIERRPSNDERLEILRDLFPEVFTDRRLSADRLKELLEDGVSDSEVAHEHYELSWVGKRRARRLAHQAAQATLRNEPGVGIDETSTRNALIVGDNLQALLALQKSYAGSVGLVYIDPPYNTGGDLLYKDDFSQPVEKYLEATGQADLNGVLVSNPKTNGRYHSDWLTMLYPRLKVAWTLLSDEGIIAISIDDNEVHNLRFLLDEVFGQENFVAQIAVSLNPKGRQLAEFFATSHEYLLIYSRTAGSSALNPSSTENVKVSDFPLTDANGRYRLLPLRNTNKKFNPKTRPNLFYALYVDRASGAVTLAEQPGLERIEPVFGDGTSAVWRWGREKVARQSEELFGRLVSGRQGERWDVFQKDRYTEERTKKINTVWLSEDVGSTDGAVSELKELIGPVFPSPKPTKLLRRIIRLVPDDSMVMDFFAGSGTTGHAVMAANAEDGGTRSFILMQLPEPVDAQGYATIADITRARLHAASTALKEDLDDATRLDLGFRVFKEDSPALARPLHLAAEQLEKGQVAMFKEKLAHVQPTDLFTEVLLLLGFPLDTKREQVPQDSANTLWRFEHPRVPQPLLLCLDQKVDDDLLDALRDKRSHIFVCRDEALTDVSKARFYDALKLADSTFKVL
jgi:adenine-specific DNA-methyltransferase